MSKPYPFAVLLVSSLLLACAAQRDRVAPAAPARAESHAAAAPEPRVDPESIARAELTRLTGEHGVNRAAIVILDPATGRILAAVGAGPDGDGLVRRAVPTGSTMKTLTVAAALEDGLDPGQRFTGDDGEVQVGGETLRDASASDYLDAERTLVRSSNVGAVKIAQAHFPAVRAFLEKVRWSAPIVEGAEGGAPAAADWTPKLAAGLGSRASPLFLAAVYAAVVNGGELVVPTRDGTGTRRRLLGEGTAARLRSMLTVAVEEGSGKRAAVEGVRVAGKTGTAAAERGMWGHFVGFAPVESPRWVIAVGVQSDEESYLGGTVAAPSFARLVTALHSSPER